MSARPEPMTDREGEADPVMERIRVDRLPGELSREEALEVLAPEGDEPR